MGDLNTKYFHNCTRERFNHNKILSLTLEDRSVVYEVKQIHQKSVKLFHTLFAEPPDPISLLPNFRNFVGKTIPTPVANDLIKCVSKEEIKPTIFH